MKKIFWFICLTAVSFTFFSCDDDDDDPTNTEIISKTWRVSTYTVQNGVEGTDRSGYTFTFTTAGTYTFNTPSAVTGTWQFQNGSQDRVIVLDGSEQVDVLGLTATSLILEFESPTFKDPNRIIRYDLVPN